MLFSYQLRLVFIVSLICPNFWIYGDSSCVSVLIFGYIRLGAVLRIGYIQTVLKSGHIGIISAVLTALCVRCAFSCQSCHMDLVYCGVAMFGAEITEVCNHDTSLPSNIHSKYIIAVTKE